MNVGMPIRFEYYKVIAITMILTIEIITVILMSMIRRKFKVLSVYDHYTSTVCSAGLLTKYCNNNLTEIEQ